MKTVIDLTNLTIPGTWIFGTETFSWISAIIRGAEEAERKGLISGLKAVGDTKIPSHTVLVKRTTSGGNIICSEMTYPYPVGTSNRGNNDFNLTEEYGINILANHICGVFRCPDLDDDEALQAKATQWMVDQHRKGKEYGILNLLADLGIGKIDNNKEVCIQYGIAFHIWLQKQTGSFQLPKKWVLDGDKPNVVSLEEAVEWCKVMGWSQRYTKQVSDDYNPHKEIESNVKIDF
jgi:hypothetical protein